MQAGYNYRIKKVPSNWDIPYGVAMIIKEEGTHIDPALQARLSANQLTSVIARHPELNKETIAFKGTVPKYASSTLPIWEYRRTGLSMNELNEISGMTRRRYFNRTAMIL